VIDRLRRTTLHRWTGTDADLRREQRVMLLMRLVERFLYDLGLLIAGRSVDQEDYVAAAVRARLHDALRPLQDSGCVIRPEFGEYAQVRIEGDLLDTSMPVLAAVDFEDRSSRLAADGVPLPRRRRQVRLLLEFDPDITTVLHHHVELA